MRADQFDKITKQLATRRVSRRVVLKSGAGLLAGSLLGGGAALLPIASTLAVCSGGSIDNNNSSIGRCSPGQTCCSGYCVYPMHDSSNCGSCFHSCSLVNGETCLGGICSGGQSSGGGQSGSGGSRGVIPQLDGVFPSQTGCVITWDPLAGHYLPRDAVYPYLEIFTLTYYLAAFTLNINVGTSIVATDPMDLLNYEYGSVANSTAIIGQEGPTTLYDSSRNARGVGASWSYQESSVIEGVQITLSVADTWYIYSVVPGESVVAYYMRTYLNEGNAQYQKGLQVLGNLISGLQLPSIQ